MNARQGNPARGSRIASYWLIAFWAVMLIAVKFFGDTVSRAH